MAHWIAPLLSVDARRHEAIQAHALLGTCLLAQQDAGGLWYLEQVVLLQPETVSYRLMLAEGYRQLGDEARALAVYQEILELAPNHRTAQRAVEELSGHGPQH